jgi:hypothetical protein
MPAGSWLKVNRNRNIDVLTPSNEWPSLGADGGPAGIWNQWSSLAWDGKRRKIYIWGPGHAGYYGNELYGFNTQTGLWERMCLPADNVLNQCTETYPGGSNPFNSKDGPINSPAEWGHPYQTNQYLSVLDRFVVCPSAVRSLDCKPTGPYLADPSKFDPFTTSAINNGSRYQKCGGAAGSDRLGLGLAGNMWQNLDVATKLGTPWGFIGSISINAVCGVGVENGRDVYYVRGMANGNAIGLWKWTPDLVPANNTFAPVGSISYGVSGTGAYAADISCFFEQGFLKPTGWRYWDTKTVPGAQNTDVAFVPLDKTDGAFAASHPPCSGYTWLWDTTTKSFLGWGGGPDVYSLSPPMPLSSHGWVLARQPAWRGEGPPSVGANFNTQQISGMWKFLREYGVALGVQDFKPADVWIYKPA